MATFGAASINDNPSLEYLLPGQRLPPRGARYPLIASRPEGPARLRAFERRLVDGGNAPTFVLELDVAPTQRRTFRQTNSTARAPWAGVFQQRLSIPNFEVDTTHDNVDVLIDSVKKIIAANLGNTIENRPYSITVSFKIDSDDSFGWMSLSAMTNRQATNIGDITFLERFNEALMRITESDASKKLNANTVISVKGHATDVGNGSQRRGGCVGEMVAPDSQKRVTWSPPADSYCLVYCLELFRRIAAGSPPSSMTYYKAKPHGAAKELMARLAAHEPDVDFADPASTIPVFHAIGNKLCIYVHFNNAIEPTRFGDATWASHYIRQLGGHFVVVLNPEVHYNRDRTNSKGQKIVRNVGPQRVVNVPGVGFAVAGLAKSSKIALDQHNHLTTMCVYCERPAEVCPAVSSLAGRAACLRCGCKPNTATCREIHESICDKPYSCNRCKAEFECEYDKAKHVCEAKQCKNCGEVAGLVHQCILEKKKPKPCPHGLVAYDLETRCRSDGVMEAVCCCVSWLTFEEDYVAAVNDGGDLSSFATWPDIERESYVGSDCVTKFVDDLLVKKRWAHHTVAAHNGSKFDAHFLLEEIVRRGLYSTVDIITDATSVKAIISRSRGGRPKKDGPPKPPEIFVVDSMSHVPLALRAACKAFGVKSRKTFFSFKRLDAWAADGMPLDLVTTNPSFEEYPACKTPDDEVDLRVHIASREGKPFHFVRELVEYCQIDCDAQLEMMLKFHEVFIAETASISADVHMSPWAFMTGAAASFDSWSILSYDPEANPLATSPAPLVEYGKDNEARGIKWLAIEERRRGQRIEGILYGGKVRVPGSRIFCHGRQGNTIFDMLYCNFSGCPHCHGSDEDADAIVNSARGMSQLEARKSMEEKAAFIERLGFEYVSMRQCEFLRTLPSITDELEAAMSGYRNMVRLNVRRCYTGGRVEPGSLYYKCAPDEILRSFDAVSLYPSVMVGKYEYPCGKPTIFIPVADPQVRADFDACVAAQNVDRYFGLIRARVLVDRTRHHHPLVFRHNPGTPNEKLVASACFKCGERTPIRVCEHDEDLRCTACPEGKPCNHVRCCSDCQASHMSAECTHGDEERAFWVECTTEELKMALRDGDKLLDISEVHHFERRGNPTRDYIFAWYKAKQRASGWPPHVEAMSPGPERTAAEDAVLADLDRQSIVAFGRPMDLKREEIVFNAGARQVAKIMLNSFYGKFGTRPERTSVAYVHDADELAKVVDKKNKSLSVSFIVKRTEDEKPVTVMLCESDESNAGVANSTSVYVAIFVTAYGRLKLYDEQLKPTGDKALYWDTGNLEMDSFRLIVAHAFLSADSCLKVMKRADPIPPCSDFLGEWGHEPEKDAVAFASLAPKTYALDLESGKTMAKCKGISKAKANVEMNVEMFRQVLAGERACILTHQEQWARTNAAIDGDCGYKIKVTRDFGRTTRMTAAKRAPAKPIFEADGETLKAIATVPFGHSSLVAPQI